MRRLLPTFPSGESAEQGAVVLFLPWNPSTTNEHNNSEKNARLYESSVVERHRDHVS